MNSSNGHATKTVGATMVVQYGRNVARDAGLGKARQQDGHDVIPSCQEPVPGICTISVRLRGIPWTVGSFAVSGLALMASELFLEKYMKYRLVALDLDGTLLDSQLQIRSETIDALNRARAQGVQVMIVTGRHHVAAYPYWHQLGLELPAICCNGAYMYDYRARRPLASDPLTRQEARSLLKLARKHNIYTMVYVKDFMAFETKNAHLKNMLKWSATLPETVRPRIDRVESFEHLVEEAGTIWKFTSAGEDRPTLSAFVSDIEQSIGLNCVWSGQTRLDIAHAGNSKGNRLSEWIAEQGIAREEVIAFGDEQNDMEMLRMAGQGVAMGNSAAVVQASADWVTGSNDSDGIADALRRFVLTAS
jgi:Cof subfamily protein (haloacid dehalogenase superfamily)